MRPYGLFDTPLVVFSNWMTRFAYCDNVAHKCDFMGINYYGQVGMVSLDESFLHFQLNSCLKMGLAATLFFVFFVFFWHYLTVLLFSQEVISAPGLKNVENEEYSESGRGVYPDGLYRMLLQFHERYKQHNMKFIITENGVSDATDYIRRPYIIEHLLAVRAAMDKVHTKCSQ